MKRIDSFPTHKIGGLEYRAGRVFPFGASLTDDAVNFSIFSKEAVSCTLLLYHTGEREPYLEIPFPKSFRIGNVYSMMVFGLDIDCTEYGYRMDGPYDPSRGLYFNPDVPLLDPYARSVSGRTVWGEKPDWTNPFQHRGRIIRQDFDWEEDMPPEIPQKDLVIYEAHVRGFTRHPSSGSRHPGTFAGMRRKIPYLRELGINCVELLPVFEFDEFEFQRGCRDDARLNYWGYSTLNFFAPKAGYAYSGPEALEADEFKNLIKMFHKNGIEVLLDVVFNHTAEGNQDGPVISYRGIDNRTYYLLDRDSQYYNFSGCGNTMNCNNAVVRNHILDCLRYWVSEYHIDGFRFDLASIMTRDADGAPMLSPPILESLARDAVLGNCKLIAEAWDAGGLYQVGSFPSWNRWAEWNGRYRDCLRRFIKGDAQCAPELYIRIGGSEDLYHNRSAEASINFITCHDGFTLYDLVSYNEKHNEANGEQNRDGTDDNASWNCGAEGETDDPAICSLRERQMKNFFTILLTSRGVPMLLAGDEFAHSQSGNNNAYCQDSVLSWLDWSGLKNNKALFDCVKTLLAIRKAHPVLRCPTFDRGYNGTGYPELSFHGPVPWQLDEHAPALSFAYLYAEDHVKYGTQQDCFIYIIVNAHWEGHDFQLPIIPQGMRWRIAVRSDSPSRTGAFALADGRIYIGPRASAVLESDGP